MFGLGGSWTKLLYRADGYLLTEVWCESAASGQYRVRDFWNWHRNFEIFRGRFHDDFEHFEQWLHSEGLIESERFLGAYYEKLDDGSEDLILS